MKKVLVFKNFQNIFIFVLQENLEISLSFACLGANIDVEKVDVPAFCQI